MILKPKSTVRNPKALVYRRFTQLQDSYSTNTIYKTEDDKFWAFNGNNSSFIEIDVENMQTYNVVEIATRGTILEYQNKQFIYDGQWEQATNGASFVELQEQPTFYEQESDTYWAIVQASDNSISTKQVSTPTSNVINIDVYPAMYMCDGFVATFLANSFKVCKYRSLSTVLSVCYQTSDNRYWQFVDGLMVEILTPVATVYEIDDYEILIENIIWTSSTPRQLAYYDGTQWQYAQSNIYTEEYGYYPYDDHAITDNVKYYTNNNGEYWFFYDNTKQIGNQMIKVTGHLMARLDQMITFDENAYYVGKDHTYKFETNEFVIRDNIILPDSQFLSAKFGNIARYQTNKYYFVGSFDYMIRGSIEGTTTQHIKGNIMPLTSLNIKYFNDEIDLDVDDLVVIEDHLFSVENPETVQKRMPKAFKVHFATLNSIL